MEARLEGSIRRLQLDNQMLDATQPVVLVPTSVAHSRLGTAQAALGDADLITFGMSRSFANNMVALVTDTAVSPQPRAPAVKGQARAPLLVRSLTSFPKQRFPLLQSVAKHRTDTV